MYENLLTTQFTKYIHKMFLHSFSKEWYTTYWCFDLHGTIIRPSYESDDRSVIYYPFVKEVLRLITLRDDIKTILWTSSSESKIKDYIKILNEDSIEFDRINENPNISSSNGNFGHYDKKFYFNILFDDKAAFDPENDWEPIYNLLIKYRNDDFLPSPEWTTKY